MTEVLIVNLKRMNQGERNLIRNERKSIKEWRSLFQDEGSVG
jgi:hypothetical protein